MRMSARFTVEKTSVDMSYRDVSRKLENVNEADEDNELMEASNEGPVSESAADKYDGAESEDSDDAHVFGDDYKTHERVSTLINRLAQYGSPLNEAANDNDRAAIVLQTTDVDQYKQKSRPSKERKNSRQMGRDKGKVGTVLGVYLPCLQNIFGVILLLRLAWLVGVSGIFETVGLILVCAICVLLTVVSLSAIATNTVVPSGGVYMILMRSFGAELGGVVGILLYLTGVLVVSLHCLGACELLLRFLLPQAAIFNDDLSVSPINKYVTAVHQDLVGSGCSAPQTFAMLLSLSTSFGGSQSLTSTIYNNYRVYGLCFLVFVFFCVFLGVKVLSKITYLAFGCILLVLLSAIAGLLVNSISDPLRPQHFCALGDVLYTRTVWSWRCNAYNETIDLCSNAGRNESFLSALHCNATTGKCDSLYSGNTLTSSFAAFPGASLATLTGNSMAKHDKTQPKSMPLPGQVLPDLTTDWQVALGILFNAFSGFLVATSGSVELRNPHRSIPLGMFAAVITATGIYLLLAFLFSLVVPEVLLRDKFGESLGRTLMIAEVAWPHKMVVLVAGFFYLLLAALQQLSAAPRLLASVSRDGVLPVLSRFAVTSKRGEPIRALLLTVFLCCVCISVASFDRIAPFCAVLTLCTYLLVNMACLLQTVLRMPNWRPRFKYYHWTAALLGCLCCAVVMFMICWHYALVILVAACAVYKYIEYKGAEKEWGDGLTGLAMSAARYALLRLEHAPALIKNWRPQILYVTRCGEELQPLHSRTFDFLSQLKAGRGLTLLIGLLEGNLGERMNDVQLCKQALCRLTEQKRIKGLCDVLVAESQVEGMRHAVQIAGLGGLKHNTVVIDWPYDWKSEVDNKNSSNSNSNTNLNANSNSNSSANNNNNNVQRVSLGDAPVGSTRPNFNPQENAPSTSSANAAQPRSSFQADQHLGASQSWRLFVESVRTTKAAGCALLVPKDISRFPANNEVLERGTIDVWWIVHDGGLLLLLPFLLMQHRVWRNCRLRIFTVAEMQDNSVQMKRELKNALYHLRIHADFEVVEMGDSEISAYTYERTLCMEQRGQFLRGLRLDDGERIALIQSFMDKAHEAAAKGNQAKEKKLPPIQEDKVLPAGARPINPNKNQYTFSAPRDNSFRHRLQLKKNARKMHTAVRLNQFILQKSANARLVVVNMPSAPRDARNDAHFMTYLDVLTENLPRVLLVHGTGKEFITVYG